MPMDMPTVEAFEYHRAISDICEVDWSSLTEKEVVQVAWAYYFFSIQFRENLKLARELFPDDADLVRLEREECNTDNLSPWPGVADAGEKLNHDEFMRRVLTLEPISDVDRNRFKLRGEGYLEEVRAIDPMTRALSIASYEDGGLESVFTAMLKAPAYDTPLVSGFRFFLSEHVRFDSDPDQGHGSLTRQLRPDDRILPLWVNFRELLTDFVPRLAA